MQLNGRKYYEYKEFVWVFEEAIKFKGFGVDFRWQ